MKELIVFVIVCYAIVKLVKWLATQGGMTGGSSSWDRNDSVASSKEEKVQISKNIYGAVETFATLCHMWKKNTGWPYEKLDFAWIKVEYADNRVNLEMQCRGDCLARQLLNSFPELSADSDNIVVYKSNEVHSLDPKNPQALWAAFKAGSPNAVLENISATPGHIFINISFEN